MGEARFKELRQALLEAGIAGRHARRAAGEMQDHFQQLVDDARRRGLGEVEARADAHAALGTNEALVERYACRPELLALSSRRPALWFTLAPLVCYLAVSAAFMAVLVFLLSEISPYLHRIRIPPGTTRLISAAASTVFLGLIPALVAALFGVAAYRRRMSIRWPLTGIAAVGLLAGLINVDLFLTGGTDAGHAGAGIGLTIRTLPMQLLRMAAVALPAAALLYLATRRAGRHRDRARRNHVI